MFGRTGGWEKGPFVSDFCRAFDEDQNWWIELERRIRLEERGLVVIGDGPAGLRAAATAARRGVEVTVIGENPRYGGQIFRQIVPPLQAKGHIMDLQDLRILDDLQEELTKVSIEFLNKTIVWGIFDDKVIVTDRSEKSQIKAKKIVIAEGAYEAPVAFRGWTLPGVMTLGGLQILLKSQGIIPKGKVVIAGTGPLLFYTASQLVEKGADVVAVLEASSMSQWMRWSMKLVRMPGILRKGIKYLNILRKHRVPIHYSTVPLEAKGSKGVEEVVAAKVNESWHPLPGTGKKIPAEFLCLNFGFIPSTQFSHIAGCEHVCDIQLRGWVPKFDSNYETSVDGIYVAGDCTGIGGVKKAVLEGELVGNEVACRLGFLPRKEADERLSLLKKKIKNFQWYQLFLKNIYAFRPGLLDLLTEETIICRCEEIPYETISRLIENKSHRLEQIKLLSRVGMGRCQGRFCYPTLLGIFSKRLSPDMACSQDFTGRIPAKPLPLESVFDISNSDEAAGSTNS
jgi:NADPH-dependent 2,4-dienoyl-CoA reductase/sulfur reductase-like enzyme